MLILWQLSWQIESGIINMRVEGGVWIQRDHPRRLKRPGPRVETGDRAGMRAPAEYLRQNSLSFIAGWVGLTLLAVVWGSTFFLQVPAHEKLASRFDATTHRRLVRSNWIRTVGWTFRGILVCRMSWQAMDAPVRSIDSPTRDALIPVIRSLM